MVDQWHVKVLKPTRKLWPQVRRLLLQKKERNVKTKKGKGDNMPGHMNKNKKKVIRKRKPKMVKKIRKLRAKKAQPKMKRSQKVYEGNPNS